MKLTREEKNWILYDVGNSAFVLLVSTILPIYFNYLAQGAGLTDAQYLAYWGYAASIATIKVAIMGPVMGTMADMKGVKKILFTVTMLVGAAGCILLGFARQWFVFLVIYIIAKVGFSSSLIFYDAMLTDVTEDERMDEVSSYGYARCLWECFRVVFRHCRVHILPRLSRRSRWESTSGLWIYAAKERRFSEQRLWVL